ncbi:MAG: hypothetical protein KatS3mg086_156 [Candidatus Dojkabacteria bacterium]|nr:MAG: hypothetical protein KatS3mg086_156 [Candidatus Dojkabacteria bacterium]
MIKYFIEHKWRKINLIKIVNIANLAIFVFVFINPVWARSVSDIQNEINQQEQELENVKETLENALKELQDTESKLNNQQSELEKLNSEISLIDQQININNVELEVLKKEIEVRKLEKVKREKILEKTLAKNYMDWRAKDTQMEKFLLKNNIDDSEKHWQYDSFFVSIQQEGILSLLEMLQDLKALSSEYDKKLQELQAQNSELEAKKQKLENELLALQNAIYATNNNIVSLQSQQQNIESKIKNLLEEQKQAFEYERKILEQDPGGGGGNINEGEWFFYGSGRDLYQGHGVGMSQWGAHGMALNGFTYDQILIFYYENSYLQGGFSKQINVDGYGSMDIETYVSGLGEVPNKACGNPDQVQSNPEKYVIDDPNTSWDCWPEEAIKAQVVAARTYAWWYTSVRGSICTTASCQVYSGGNGKAWAAQETSGQLVLYNGSPIEAVYSSDNNQGYGTADNDTIWQNIYGDGTPYPYLRSKNDNDYATPTQWTNWTYQTSGFLSQDINNMLNFVVNNSSYSLSVKNAISSIISEVGEIESLSFVRDNSLRVKKVILKGTNGVEKSIGGWWFKNIWNTWAYETGRGDYIYSQTFFLSSK